MAFQVLQEESWPHVLRPDEFSCRPLGRIPSGPAGPWGSTHCSRGPLGGAGRSVGIPGARSSVRAWAWREGRSI